METRQFGRHSLSFCQHSKICIDAVVRVVASLKHCKPRSSCLTSIAVSGSLTAAITVAFRDSNISLFVYHALTSDAFQSPSTAFGNLGLGK